MSAYSALALPEDFLHRFNQIVPQHTIAECLHSFSLPTTVVLKVNTLKTDSKTLMSELSRAGFTFKPLPWYPDCFISSKQQLKSLKESDAYCLGKFSLQNPSSLLAVLALSPQPGEEILDLGAAPGYKTLQMACAMNNRGRIAAIEIVKQRYYKLKTMLNTYGVENTHPQFKDGGKIWKYSREQFDKVLLDAPCSHEAGFRDFNPATYKYWSINKITEMQSKQRRLLFSGVQCLKPGGFLIYTTATYAPEENECVINRILEKFSNSLRIEPIELPINNIQAGLCQWNDTPLDPALAHAVRILPTKSMEGFFMCKIRKVNKL